MTEKSDIEKLRILVAHWIDHNHSHEAEMTKWLTVAKDAGQGNTVACLEEAIAGMKQTDGALDRALETLGGPLEDHHHHHH